MSVKYLMNFERPLITGKIIKRYKRFLSDIQLDNGEIIVAHVPNTGSMKTCWEPGWKVYLSQSDNPKRKLKYTLELIHNGDSFIALNTTATNKIVKEALEKKLIPELSGHDHIKPEVKILESRLDFMLTDSASGDKTYVEVKNVTLRGKNKAALFPDAVTTRGQKHLSDLISIKKLGHRAVMLYLVNRQDVDHFLPAYDIDPVYASLLKDAHDKGMEVLVYQTAISPSEIIVDKKLGFSL